MDITWSTDEGLTTALPVNSTIRMPENRLIGSKGNLPEGAKLDIRRHFEDLDYKKYGKSMSIKYTQSNFTTKTSLLGKELLDKVI